MPASLNHGVLVKTCPGCGSTLLDDNLATCSACGEPLGGTPAFAAQEPRPVRPPSGEPAFASGGRPHPFAPPVNQPGWVSPDAVPMVDANENSFLGISPYTLRTGEALQSLALAGGVLMLCVFALPWIMGGSGIPTIWSWSNLDQLRGFPGLGGAVRFFMFFPLVVGVGFIVLSRVRVAPLVQATLFLLAGVLPVVILNAKLYSVPGHSGFDVIGFVRLLGIVGLSIGLTMRAIRSDTKIGRPIILVSAILFLIGCIVPGDKPVFFEAKSWLGGGWEMLTKGSEGEGYYRVKIPPSVRLMGLYIITTVGFGALSLVTLKEQRDPYADSALGTAKFLSFQFTFYVPLMIFIGMLPMMNGRGAFLMLWFGMKFVVYTGLIFYWLAIGSTALIELAAQPTITPAPDRAASA